MRTTPPALLPLDAAPPQHFAKHQEAGRKRAESSARSSESQAPFRREENEGEGALRSQSESGFRTGNSLNSYTGRTSADCPLQQQTFITFSDDTTFEEWFPQNQPPKVSPVTHHPDLYWDRVTDIPYATAGAFKVIREAYEKYIATLRLLLTASALEPLPGSGPQDLRQKIVIK
ncbi:Vacuolar protein sorting-associated protein 72 like protein [Tupaia chinensis]|uniref:Vacuolar protein sorting-associated protein 72 like protein n=1 Tax=Tupaia chinensis TaxID=246437 RepID=L9KHI1_TUPCH|nr:Vacuolar protein sorting-associated protein 72 like protein [Tupaia chinensis]